MLKARHWLIIALLMLFIWPQQVSAHASLIQAVPGEDSQLEESPERIVLTFNQALEPNVQIKVVDYRKNEVTREKAVLSEDRQELSVGLPKLQNGTYTVTYRVSSADGHTVAGSYVFTIGEPDPAQLAAQRSALSGSGKLSWKMGLLEYAAYLIKILYYISLLCLTGWVFWRLFYRRTPELVAQIDRKWSLGLQRAYLLVLILLVAVELPSALGEWTTENLTSFIGTSKAISWMVSIGLSLLGFVILHRSRLADAAWLVLLLAAKSFTGHANGLVDGKNAVLIDLIHLLAAAVWVGGLLYLTAHWRRNREHALQFLPQFSFLALDSMILLVLSGVFILLLFLPNPAYLLYTQWGTALLIKISLVLIVIVAGIVVRRFIKKKKFSSLMTAVKIEIGLMVAIVSIVGVLTALNPLPPNKPLNWHEMGEELHMTAKIAPNIPGARNTFTLQVWVPKEEGEPQKVQMILKHINEDGIEPIPIPLQPASANKEQGWFPGYTQYVYSYEGSSLAFPGEWTVEVRVTLANGEKKEYEKSMKVY
ncbi:copper resistance CopC/CopD family protein [Paenibacillus sp. 32O-W]|uniref:copper resistance CopC/CopD family protein n=1 Tax=Paenibacillus sp. 32O-W TaxID=1695218 RepID=UPI0011A364CF|nr:MULTISPECIES: copper resistance protein CopC [Paenibacillaceae]